MGDEISQPQILFVDAYDSFAQNIVVLVRDSLHAHVTFTTIDDPQFVDASDDELRKVLARWHGIIIGPGPGHPQKSADVGWVERLWHLEGVLTTPILGICLGFQSLCAAFGAKIERLREPKHGIVGPILIKGGSLLALDQNDASYNVTHYHSLTVRLGDYRSTTLPWIPSSNCKDIQPLAWDVSDQANGLILQAVKHRNKPFWGVQYHPESICSENGPLLVRNWWEEARGWRYANRLQSMLPLPKEELPNRGNVRNTQQKAASSSSMASVYAKSMGVPFAMSTRVYSAIISPAHYLSCKAICEVLGLSAKEVVILESGTSAQGGMMHPHTGRYTIIGLIEELTPTIEYHLDRSQIIIKSRASAPISIKVSDPWEFFSEWTESMRPKEGGPDTPFWGGLMGFATYEAGLHTRLGLEVNKRNTEGGARPDILFASITRSIVIDHKLSKVYIQSILEPPDIEMEWCFQIRQRLLDAQPRSSSQTTPSESPTSRSSSILNGSDHSPRTASSTTRVGIMTKPSQQVYFDNLRACDEQIRAGNSYELCLTDRTQIRIGQDEPSQHTCWDFYSSLVRRNAAPFSAYIRLSTAGNGITIVSSSPERFLSWTRDGLCEYRPIKGTVKKGPDMTLEKAKQILSTSKEVAENLMIADLVRHDLNSVLGIKDVRVPGLFRVEEYATVYQLVSVIQGDLPAPAADIVDESRTPVSTGIDVLVQSLPPGSMTGAPKLRSCQILQDLEQKPRGIYSGVLGYLDCGGGGDFSVVIRTAFSWDDEDESSTDGGINKVWTVGAGGAVTAQSTLQGEWDEMVAKANTVLSVLGAELQ